MLPIHLPNTLTIVLGLLILFNGPAYAASVGKVVMAKEYVEIIGRWIDRKLGIHVSSGGYIFFMADTGLGQATTQFDYGSYLMARLESTVVKAIKWSKIAQKNKADVRKVLSCFGKDDEYCMNRGRAESRNNLLFEFASQNGGKRTNLIVTIVDRAYVEKKATLYLGPPEMKQLLGNIRKIDEEMNEAIAMEKKQDLFN